MSADDRWIPVSGDGWNACEASVGDDPIYGPELAKIGEAWWAAEGQRVESIRWCETHGACRRTCLLVASDLAEMGAADYWADCVYVDATLILPPKEQA